jgi:hypothetical protein
MLPLAAQLPSLSETDNLGYFAVSETRDFRYGLTTHGKNEIKVLRDKGGQHSAKLDIDLNVKIEEKMPDGKVVSRQLKVDSLESAEEPTATLGNVVYKGKVTGDTEFEVSVSATRGGILLGGRLLNPDTLKNPTRFSIDVKIPLTLPELKADPSKKDLKKYEESIEDDEVRLEWIDGGKTKIDANEPVEGASKEVTGPGIESAVIEFGAYSGKEIELIASPNSKMTLSNGEKGPLSSGFVLNWSADVAKDPEGKARLLIKID